MEISKLRFTAVLLCTILLTVGATYTLRFSQHQNAGYSANIYILLEQRCGTTDYESGNLITDLGENYVRNTIGFNNVTNWNYTNWISLSNDATPLVTWTELPGEVDNTNGFGRTNGTATAWNDGTDYAFNVSKKFTATGAATLQCAGLNWNNTLQSNNNLFAAATFTQTVFASGDNLTITWAITWDGN